MHIGPKTGHHAYPAALPRDAFGAPPGAAPFHRVLEARRIERQGHDTFELPTSRRVDPSDTSNDADRSRDAAAYTLLPRLGDVTPLPPQTRTEVRETLVRPRVVGATGRVLDLYA